MVLKLGLHRFCHFLSFSLAVVIRRVSPAFSLGAPTDHRLLPRAREEAASVDRQALLRRAEAAAKSAALRYSETCGGAVRCTFVGQPRCEGDEALSLCDIETNPQAWVIPRKADRMRLAFRWDIFEEVSVLKR